MLYSRALTISGEFTWKKYFSVSSATPQNLKPTNISKINTVLQCTVVVLACGRTTHMQQTQLPCLPQPLLWLATAAKLLMSACCASACVVHTYCMILSCRAGGAELMAEPIWFEATWNGLLLATGATTLWSWGDYFNHFINGAFYL